MGDDGQGDGDEAVRVALQRADALADVGRDREALDLLRPLLVHHPDDAVLVLEIARLTMGLGTRADLREGITLARRAVALDPHDADALCVLALGLTGDVRRWREARRLTEQAVALEPHDPAVWLAHAEVLQGTAGRDDAARAAAARAVELAPEDPAAALVLAKVAVEQHQPFSKASVADAQALLDRALALDPSSAEAHVLRANLDTGGTSAERQQAFLEAARLDPTNREALAGVDDELTFPLRLGAYLMWLLVAVQAVLLLTGRNGGTVLGLVAAARPPAGLGRLPGRAQGGRARPGSPRPRRRPAGRVRRLPVPVGPPPAALDARVAAVGGAGGLRGRPRRRRCAVLRAPPAAAAPARRVKAGPDAAAQSSGRTSSSSASRNPRRR